MPSKRYVILSMLSGCLWAGVAFYIGRQVMTPLMLLGGTIASPFIGLAAGFVFHEACRLPIAARAVLSLFTLYLTATLFGFASGLTAAPYHHRQILSVVVATLWGITFTGFVFFLWPLSFLNHELVCRFGQNRTRSKYLYRP